MSPLILKRGPFPGANSVFDNPIDTFVQREESVLSTAYVTIGQSIALTAYRYGFPTLGTYAYQIEFYASIKTSNAAATVYIRYIRDDTGGGAAFVLSEDSHTGDTNWSLETHLMTPPTVTYAYYLQLRIDSTPNIAYAKRCQVVVATIVGGNRHGFFVLRG